MTTLFPVVFGQTPLDPDAAAWRRNILAAGGSISAAALATMTREWFRPLRQEGLAPLLLDYNWLVGPDQLTGALAKPVSLVAGDTVATNANFVAADYSATSGLKGNGSSKRIDSKVPLSAVNTNSFSVFFAGTEMDTTGTRRVVSARDGGTQSIEFTSSGTESLAMQSGATSRSATGGSPVASAIYVASYLAPDIFYTRNAVVDATGSGAAGTQHTASTQINYFCRNNAGSYFDFSSGRAVFVGIGAGLTQAQAQRISALVRNTVAALGGPTLY